jgi:hypothetical protein
MWAWKNTEMRRMIIALVASAGLLSSCTGTTGGYPFRPIAVHQTPQQKAALFAFADAERKREREQAEAQKQAALKAVEQRNQYIRWYSNLTPQEQAQEDQRQAQEDRDQVQREIEWDLSNIASGLESH